MQPFPEEATLIAHRPDNLAGGNLFAHLFVELRRSGHQGIILLAMVDDQQVAVAAKLANVYDLSFVDGGDFGTRQSLDVDTIGGGGNAEFAGIVLAEIGGYRSPKLAGAGDPSWR